MDYGTKEFCIIHPEPSERPREKIKTGRGGGKETGAEARPGPRLPAFPQAGGRPLPWGGGSPGGGAAARRGHGAGLGAAGQGALPAGGLAARCPGVSESPGTGGGLARAAGSAGIASQPAPEETRSHGGGCAGRFGREKMCV